MDSDKWRKFLGDAIHPFSVQNETFLDSCHSDVYSDISPTNFEIEEIQNEEHLVNIRDMIVKERSKVRSEMIRTEIKLNRELLRSELCNLEAVRARTDTSDTSFSRRPTGSDFKFTYFLN